MKSRIRILIYLFLIFLNSIYGLSATTCLQETYNDIQIKKENEALNHQIKLKEAVIASCKDKGEMYKNSVDLFSKVNTRMSLAITMASFIIAHLDQDFDHEWIKKFGWELTTSYIFSKIPGMVMKNVSGSNARKMLKEMALVSALDFGTTRITGLIIPEEMTSNEAISKIKLDKKELQKLDDFIVKILNNPEFKRIVQKYKDPKLNLVESSRDLDIEALMKIPEIKKEVESNYLKVMGKQESEKLANEIYYYNVFYNMAAAGPKVAMYNLTTRMICLGMPKRAVSLFLFFKFFNSMVYYEGRKFFTDGF